MLSGWYRDIANTRRFVVNLGVHFAAAAMIVWYYVAVIFRADLHGG